MGPMREHPATTHPDLLVGIQTSDDAGVFSLGDGRSLVQTVDIFTPVVDSPFDWGRVAAANALSDVYAMGGTPMTALQYLAWPRDQLPFSTASTVIEGGLEVMAAAGCTVVGGHSIDSPEPTYGFAVTGLVDSHLVMTNAGAKPGDSLVLTKALGIGIITTAIKRGLCPPDVAEAAIDTMTTLNRAAGASLAAHGAHSATDVTGFGLMGHLLEMCNASHVGADVRFDDIPLIDGALDLLDAGCWAGGSQRNFLAASPHVETALGKREMRVVTDAQTSGGLIAALPPDRATDYAAAVGGSVIGEFTERSGIRLA